MSGYERMVDGLRAASHFESGRGVGEAEIIAAEARVGPFPEEYRRFLSDFGWAEFGEFTLWGLGDDLPYPSFSCVSMTELERSDGAIPEDFVAIFNDGGGNLEGFSHARESDRGAVYLIDHERRTMEYSHETFSNFVLALLMPFAS